MEGSSGTIVVDFGQALQAYLGKHRPHMGTSMLRRDFDDAGLFRWLRGVKGWVRFFYEIVELA